MAKSSKDTAQFWWLALLALLVCLTLVKLTRTKMPSDGEMTYAKYGCIPDDPLKRELDQYLGLSTCR